MVKKGLLCKKPGSKETKQERYGLLPAAPRWEVTFAKKEKNSRTERLVRLWRDYGWEDRPSNNPDALAEPFVEDGVWDCGALGYAAGREEIHDTLASFTYLKLDFHHLGDLLIKVKGDTATVEWNGLFVPINEQTGAQHWIGARYNDEFVRTRRVGSSNTSN